MLIQITDILVSDLTSMKSFSSARLRTRYSAIFPSSAGFSLSNTMSASQASHNSFKESTEALRSSALRPLAVPSDALKKKTYYCPIINAFVAYGGWVPRNC